MAQAELFPFVVTDPAFGEASRLPYMPITLRLQGRSLSVSALLDTGSAVGIRLDSCRHRTSHSRAGELFHGVRRLFLSLSIPFRS